MSVRLPILTYVAVLALSAAVLLVGCSSSPPSSTPSTGQPSGAPSSAPTPSGEAFAACMRDHGVEMSDPDPQTGVPQLPDDVDPTAPAVKKALAACEELMPPGVRDESDDPDEGQYLKFAQCMRKNGLPDFPDPQPGSDGGMFGDGVKRDDPAFQKAAAACQHLLGGE